MQRVCEAAAKGLHVGDTITERCTGPTKQGDLLPKKAGDYLLEKLPALHYHRAKRDFDIDVSYKCCSIVSYLDVEITLRTVVAQGGELLQEVVPGLLQEQVPLLGGAGAPLRDGVKGQ